MVFTIKSLHLLGNCWKSCLWKFKMWFFLLDDRCIIQGKCVVLEAPHFLPIQTIWLYSSLDLGRHDFSPWYSYFHYTVLDSLLPDTSVGAIKKCTMWNPRLLDPALPETKSEARLHTTSEACLLCHSLLSLTKEYKCVCIGGIADLGLIGFKKSAHIFPSAYILTGKECQWIVKISYIALLGFIGVIIPQLGVSGLRLISWE